MDFPGGDPIAAMRRLSAVIRETVEKPKGRFRVEDLISAAAAFAGENMLRQVDDFDFSNHDHSPGQALFSTVANVCLSGDRSEWPEIPITSAFGRLFALLPALPNVRYPQDAFPNVGDIYRTFAARRGNGVSKQEWGTAPLTISSNHWPIKIPLRSAYEIRDKIFEFWKDEPPTPFVLSELAQMCLLEYLSIAESTGLLPVIALKLAMETMNAMAKTAPFLPKHIALVGQAS